MRGHTAGLSLVALLAVASAASAAPDLVFRGAVVLDRAALGGDNDRHAEPGESFDLRLTLGNEGDDTAFNVSATLASAHPQFVVDAAPASVSFPDIAVDALESDPGPHFRVTAMASLPCAEPGTFVMQVSYEDSFANPLSVTLRFLIFAGEMTVLVDEDFDSGEGGWAQDDNASTGSGGRWVTAAPDAYQWMGEPAQPGRDETFPDVSCMFTGQGNDEVDAGTQVLVSRVYDLSGQSGVWLSYHRWFHSDDLSNSDSWEIQASDDDGLTWATVERIDTMANAWTPQAVLLDPLIGFTSTVLLRVIVEDTIADSNVEGAIDGVRMSIGRCEVDPAEAVLSVTEPTIFDGVDPLCSDADNVPDAGETFDFSVTVENSGTAIATGADATLQTPLPPELSLSGPATVPLGDIADNGGAATATWRLTVMDPITCQTPVDLDVDPSATSPFTATPLSTPLILEEDVNQPVLRWADDFDSGLPDWTVELYNTVPPGNSDWAKDIEDCVKNPGSPPTPAVNFWYTGSTGVDKTDCSVDPYNGDNDEAIRSPVIDTGFSKPLLLELSWNQLLTLTPGDLDVAEIHIDHDGDGTFTKIAEYFGLTTTNGDLLDTARIDLQNTPLGVDLTDTQRLVQLEFRFRTDTGPGGGPDEALGWIVDNVELTWTDAEGRTCDANVCGTCQSVSLVQPSDTQECTDELINLDGASSTLAGCPSPGVPVYDWFREGLPLMSGPDNIDVTETVAGAYTYRLDVSCSTDPSCVDSATQILTFIDCPNCAAAATIAPAPTEICAGEDITLDASSSTLTNCPSPGVAEYQWLREGLPVGVTDTLTRNEPTPGTFTYEVEIVCSTDPNCKDTMTHVLTVNPDGNPGPVGNTLLGIEAAPDVELTWSDPQVLAVSWNVDRTTDKQIPFANIDNVATPTWRDVGAMTMTDSYLYLVRAVSCSGNIGP